MCIKKLIICSECEELVLEDNMSKENPSICLDCEGEKALSED